ncbi:BatA domain-containing protein [Luteimonas sp. RD2P54]|uniref:BatA domain-containing protein n=1 Tax=Luteimonas endophytica TaxID=3042023 RepID=A0ABT6JCE4_9GAMM|nr:BatA domain-containing protein [Luteimonas endophytica]MDH5824434.1 BatA domain-containing protein [Luteimonas endophytica]
MSFGLLLPAALSALAALLLPLAIHLARRSEQRPTVFAALRWLRQRPKPRHRVRFDEWPLLLLRLLLLAMLALWLARPVLYGAPAATRWIVAAPGVEPAALAGAVAADGGDEISRRWLAPGFPPLAEPEPRGSVALSSLLRQLDAELPAEAALTVLVPERLSGVDAERPRLSRAVDWRVLPGTMPAPAVAPRRPPVLVVRHAAERAPALRYLRAAAQAWHGDDGAQPRLAAGAADAALPAAGQVLVWLVPGPLPERVRRWIEAGGTALLDAAATIEDAPRLQPLWRDDLGMPLAEGAASGRGRLLRLTRPLRPAAMPQLLEPEFPHRLRAVLEPPPPPPARALAAEHAPLGGAAAWPQPPRELRPWWALLVALLVLAERWLATSRRRGGAP